LPFWVVKELNADQVVNVTVPKGYNQNYREILEADANCVNLHKMGPNFYRVGQHLASMNLPESENIANSMVDTYTQRFHRLVNFALSGSNVGNLKESKNGIKNLSKSNHTHNPIVHAKVSSTTDDLNALPELLSYQNSLDNWEKELLTVGQATARQVKRWENRDLVKVTPNEMITNMHKRKRLIEKHVQYQQNASHLSQQQGQVNGRASSPMPSTSSSSDAAAAFKS